MATVIPFEDIRVSPTASLFEGGDDVAASIFVLRYEHGDNVGLHMHPYPEVFVVTGGTGTFTVRDEDVTVTAGHVLIVPPQTPHGFRNERDETLRVVSVHTNGKVIQTDA